MKGNANELIMLKCLNGMRSYLWQKNIYQILYKELLLLFLAWSWICWKIIAQLVYVYSLIGYNKNKKSMTIIEIPISINHSSKNISNLL